MVEGADAVAVFARRIGAMPATMMARIRAEMEGVGEDVAADARSRASWSSRIPATIKAKVTVKARSRIELALRAGGPSAPHARPFEDITRSGSGSFRHPVFGDRDVWVPQATRPFLRPAMEAKRSLIEKAVMHAVEDAAQIAGWK